jgi:hypothetical protein
MALSKPLIHSVAQMGEETEGEESEDSRGLIQVSDDLDDEAVNVSRIRQSYQILMCYHRRLDHIWNALASLPPISMPRHIELFCRYYILLLFLTPNDYFMCSITVLLWSEWMIMILKLKY